MRYICRHRKLLTVKPFADRTLNPYLHRILEFARFYASAQTKYQIHSPFVFDLVSAVVEDERHFYAFEDVERVREKMLESDADIEVTDFGAGEGGTFESAKGIHVQNRVVPLRRIVRLAGSNVRQSRRLFRLAQFCKPKRMLELGTSVGVGTMYLASAANGAQFLSLEGCENCAEVARVNLDILNLKNVQIVDGAFEITLVPSLERLKNVDFVFFDGNHRREPTVRYFETCLRYASDDSVFVFDDIYWSKGMTEAWEHIQEHPRVTLTIDFFDIALAFFSPDFKEKQHFKVVPARWKPWKIF